MMGGTKLFDLISEFTIRFLSRTVGLFLKKKKNYIRVKSTCVKTLIVCCLSSAFFFSHVWRSVDVSTFYVNNANATR